MTEEPRVHWPGLVPTPKKTIELVLLHKGAPIVIQPRYVESIAKSSQVGGCEIWMASGAKHTVEGSVATVTAKIEDALQGDAK